MKQLLISLIVICCIAVSFGFMRTPKEPSEVILIRGYIWIGSANVNTVKIYRGSTPVEIVELPKTKTKEAFDENMSAIMQNVNKFTAQGYQLISSTELGAGATVILDFTLTK